MKAYNGSCNNNNSTGGVGNSNSSSHNNHYNNNGVGSIHNNSSNSSYAQALVTFMTIDEMRTLHARAVRDAEAKKTELRLVLASRYKELVGSSDQVLKMKDRSQELHDLVQALPSLLDKLIESQPPHHQQQYGSSDCNEETKEMEHTKMTEKKDQAYWNKLRFRRALSSLPRNIYRSLDANDIYMGAIQLLQLMDLVAAHPTEALTFPLATSLSQKMKLHTFLSTTSQFNHTIGFNFDKDNDDYAALETQIRMVYLQVESLPRQILHRAQTTLLEHASSGCTPTKHSNHSSSSSSSSSSTYSNHNKNNKESLSLWGAERSASCLAVMNLLNVVTQNGHSSADLLEVYYSSKSKLLMSCLERLSSQITTSSTTSINSSNIPADESNDTKENNNNDADSYAEFILSKIIRLIQYDCILHPYQIFILRKFPWTFNSDEAVMSTLPSFDPIQVKARCSKFLQLHLPLIRTKVKTILVNIAGTTSSALGQIRQRLYDKTDGIECIESLSMNGACSWFQAVNEMVDSQIGGMALSSPSQSDTEGAPSKTASATSTLTDSHTTNASSERRFSLWSALFSHTFSSLVHSILTSSFASIHTSAVAALRASLQSAPSLSEMLQHEAYRNTLQIATDLNNALVKLSDDAHELLVHAEERAESERRLRQSLYVQTCEIMGRILCELRRMVNTASSHHDAIKCDNSKSPQHEEHSASQDVTRDFIVGRLCFLLKFRLSSLPTLLDPSSSRAVLHNTSTGMISPVDLRSAFDLADDDDDGLVSFEEASEAMETAFSGTPWRGAELIRETLLIEETEIDLKQSIGARGFSRLVANVTFQELALLGARGLRHEKEGLSSALGLVQTSLDNIIQRCFSRWASAVLKESAFHLDSSVGDFMATACNVNDEEWRRLHGEIDSTSAEPVNDVSSHVLCHLLQASSFFNRMTCPSDFLSPVSSEEYAQSLGIPCNESTAIKPLAECIRLALMHQSLTMFSVSFDKHVLSSGSSFNEIGCSALFQLYLNVSFVQKCYLEREKVFGVPLNSETINEVIDRSYAELSRRVDLGDTFVASLNDKHVRALNLSALFLSSLLGSNSTSFLSSAGDADLGPIRNPSASMFRGSLQSSRRFVLLPVQADRTMSDIKIRSKYHKEKSAASNRPEATSGGVMSSGLGFLSSMLKKN